MGHSAPGGGLPIERTALAWTRSALALAVIAAVVVRVGAQGGHTAVALAAGGVLLAMALAVWALGSRAYADRRDGVPLTCERQRRLLGLITAATGASAVVAFALVVYS